MKSTRTRKPTRNQKKLISSAGYIAKQWNVVTDTDDGLIILNKTTGEIQEIKKILI